jgi:hypothetical protein
MKTFHLSLLLVFVLVICSGCSQIDEKKSTENVLFRDDFTEPGNDWGLINSEEGVIEYAQGGLRFFVRKQNTDLWTITGRNFPNVDIHVQATRRNAIVNNLFGVICRYQNSHHFYMLVVSSDGYFGALKKNGESYSLIGQEQLKYSDELKNTGDMVQLRAVCKGNQLSMFVNDRKLLDVQDDEFTDGAVGLMVGALSEPGVDILFDFFEVRDP